MQPGLGVEMLKWLERKIKKILTNLLEQEIRHLARQEALAILKSILQLRDEQRRMAAVTTKTTEPEKEQPKRQRDVHVG
jgi:hypothetical protein